MKQDSGPDVTHRICILCLFSPDSLRRELQLRGGLRYFLQFLTREQRLCPHIKIRDKRHLILPQGSFRELWESLLTWDEHFAHPAPFLSEPPSLGKAFLARNDATQSCDSMANAGCSSDLNF